MSEESIEITDIRRIMDMIPHRYPLLLVDRILEFKKDEYAIGLKNVTANEPQFTGHFPGAPVMPGVFIIESMAQTAATFVVKTLGPESEGKLVYFMTVDNARFRKPVTPGDSMHIHVHKQRSRGNVWKFKGEAKVDGKLCAEAIFSAMILDEKAPA